MRSGLAEGIGRVTMRPRLAAFGHVHRRSAGHGAAEAPRSEICYQNRSIVDPGAARRLRADASREKNAGNVVRGKHDTPVNFASPASVVGSPASMAESEQAPRARSTRSAETRLNIEVGMSS